ncbi:hypothetical protein BC830DRAFT_1163621 [Chytriomyces sp. MP71]|nr:hypothetical protein BC830DRAFT_1163621 [Chytriomyces sp. MP71]
MSPTIGLAILWIGTAAFLANVAALAIYYCMRVSHEYPIPEVPMIPNDEESQFIIVTEAADDIPLKAFSSMEKGDRRTPAGNPGEPPPLANHSFNSYGTYPDEHSKLDKADEKRSSSVVTVVGLGREDPQKPA